MSRGAHAGAQRETTRSVARRAKLRDCGIVTITEGVRDFVAVGWGGLGAGLRKAQYYAGSH